MPDTHLAILRVFSPVAVMALAACSAAPAAGATASAEANPSCAPTDDVTRMLAQQYAEHPRMQALTERGGLLRVYWSRDGETWTLIAVLPNGLSCMLSAGTDLMPMNPKPVPEPWEAL